MTAWNFSALLWLIIAWNFLFVVRLGQCRNRRRTKSNIWDQVVGRLNAPVDMKSFLIDSYKQMGDIDCATVIWDDDSSSVLGSVSFCLPMELECAYKYMINFTGGNVSSKLERALKAGYREQCGGYIILLKNPKAIVHLLHKGDDFRMINTRARFLIWYQAKDEAFERDEIWRKIPNVILFNSTMNTRTLRWSYTVLEIKWPIQNEPGDPGTNVAAIHAIDFWRHGKGLKNNDKWYYEKTTDLKNITLKILVVEHPPGVIKYTSADGEVSYAGVEIDIIMNLKDIMNFRIELVDADSDTKWGGKIGNGTENFYGAVARLIYGETDMAIGSFFILKHYLDFLDMSIPLDVACTSFLTPTPLPRPRYLALILPFNYQLWILVLFICFLFAPLGLYGLTHLKYHKKEFQPFRNKIQVVLTSFRLMCQVALDIWPKYWPVRIFIGWYWLFTLLITLAYRGAMVAFLTITLLEQPIDNLNDLAASGLRIGGWGVELERLFKQHEAGKESAVQELLAKRYEQIEDLDRGISMVAGGQFALYENIRYLKFIRQTRNLTKMGAPSMRVMKQCIVPVHIGIAYQKNSPITQTINRHIRRFRESGLTNKWGARLVQLTKDHNRAQFDEHKSDKDGEHGDDDDSPSSERKQRVLTLADLQGSMYLIFFGVFISICTFIAELGYVHTRKAAQNVNKELKKFVDLTVSKTKTVIDDRKYLMYEAQFQNKLRRRNKKKKRKIKPPPFPYID